MHLMAWEGLDVFTGSWASGGVVVSKWSWHGTETWDLTSGRCALTYLSQLPKLLWYCTAATACRATSGGNTMLWVLPSLVVRRGFLSINVVHATNEKEYVMDAADATTKKCKDRSGHCIRYVGRKQRPNK